MSRLALPSVACSLAFAALAGGCSNGSPPSSQSISGAAPSATASAPPVGFAPTYADVYATAPGTTVRLCEGSPTSPGRGLQLFFSRNVATERLAAKDALAEASGWIDGCGLGAHGSFKSSPKLAGDVDVVCETSPCTAVDIALDVDDVPVHRTVPISFYLSGD